MYRRDKQEAYIAILARSPRLLRPAQEMEEAREGALGLVSRCVLAPGLACFTEWLLRQAEENRIRRLYFLARDGCFFHAAARLLCRIRRLPLECRYLSCSRYSLRQPFYHLNREAALGHVCRGGAAVTLWGILGRAGLPEEERQPVLDKLGLPYSPKETVPHAALADIRRRLAACPLFLEGMDCHSRAALPGLEGYLRQEGLLDGVPDAVVDSGWTGTIQQTLGDVLGHMGRAARPRGYYWGLYELPAGVRREDYSAWYFSPEGPLREKVYFNNCLFEALFTAPHGMTLGYIPAPEGWAPRYGDMSVRRRAFVRREEEILLGYVRRLWERGEDTAEAGRDRETVAALMRAFMAAPSREEAAVFGALPFSDDVLEGKDQPLAAPLTGEELREGHALPKALAMAGLRQSGARESAWYEGSAVLHGRDVRRHLRQHALYQALRFARKQAAGARQGAQEGREPAWKAAGKDNMRL